MRNRLMFPLVLLTCLVASPVLAQPTASRDVVFQTATLQALLEGVYDGNLACGELRHHGDMGIGTLDALDGEMVGVDGRFYQVKADGVAYRVPDNLTTPFAVVTFFDADQTVTLAGPTDLAALTRGIDRMLPTLNIPYAIKITGTFRHVKTRSVPAQVKPYPRLVDVVKHQAVFEFPHVAGTIVGFRLPQFMDGLNAPGYHLHFLTASRRAGGHLLDCVATKVKVELDASPEFFLSLPTGEAFSRAGLNEKRQDEVKRIEK